MADSGLGKVDAQRCKNFWALGLIYWVFGRDRAPTAEWIEQKFVRKDPAIAKANVDAMNAGHAFGETTELVRGFHGYRVPRADLPPGLYRTITGGDGFALGLAAAAQLTGTEVVFASYPITPASPILHHLVKLTAYGVTTHQAEDEIAAACVAIGASYGGAIGVTSSSGPGIALKTEAIGLAVAAELPLVVINTQRAGRPPACRPRPSNRTSIRRFTGETAIRRWWCWLPTARRTASPWLSRRRALPSSTWFR